MRNYSIVVGNIQNKGTKPIWYEQFKETQRIHGQCAPGYRSQRTMNETEGITDVTVTRGEVWRDTKVVSID